jgi:hypothetical protein
MRAKAGAPDKLREDVAPAAERHHAPSCTVCGSAATRRSRTHWYERWRKEWSVARPHRCRDCGRRFWAAADPRLDASIGAGTGWLAITALGVIVVLLVVAGLRTRSLRSPASAQNVQREAAARMTAPRRPRVLLEARCDGDAACLERLSGPRLVAP